MAYRPPLHVYVVFHPDFRDGHAWANDLERWLGGDPDGYGVPIADIPTMIWTGASPFEAPPSVPLSGALQTVVIAIIDTSWLAHSTWRQWAITTASAANAAGSSFLVAAVHENAIRLGGALRFQNAIRLDYILPDQRAVEFRLRVTHYLARLLTHGGRTGIFLSHTKSGRVPGDTGGRALATALKEFLQSRPLGTVFFDEVSIEAGEDFVDRIEGGLETCVVVILLTDRFSGRYWCRWEVLTSKRKRRPMLLVDALESGEPINLPYAGNVRTVRWSRDKAGDLAMQETIVAGALLEIVRSEHNKMKARGLEPSLSAHARIEVLGSSPELATLPPPEGQPICVLHPDPPLPAFELELARLQRPDVTFASFTQAVCGTAGGESPLAGKRIALSMSDGPDRHTLGLTRLHQERIWDRLNSLLLAAGAHVAYGGDLRRGGYTVRLWDLLRGALDAGGRLPSDVVHSYLAWPIPLLLNEQARAELPDVIQLHEFRMPASLTRDPAAYIEPGNSVPQDHFAWTIAMSEMRRVMAADCDARVMLGGQFRSVSPVPGLIEEFLTFVELGKPVYLAGGFGGMTRVIGKALSGEQPIELSRAFQADGGRAVIHEYHDAMAADPKWALKATDFDSLTQRLNELGLEALNNGLSHEENLVLQESKDILEITALVLAGLFRVFPNPQGA